MDDLEKAIRTLKSPGSSTSEKLKCLEICELVMNSSNGWKICLKHLSSDVEDEVRFWCIGSLIKMLGSSFNEKDKDGIYILNFEDRKIVRESLINYLKQIKDNPNFIKNKLSELYVTLIYIDYPENWSSAFLDVISMITSNDLMPDMLIRILCTFDKMIVTNIAMQSTEEIGTRRKIKDSMRLSGDLNNIVQAWMFVVSKQKSLPLSVEVIDLISSSMRVMESFIDWIDISYAVNNEVLAIISGFLNPVESPVVVEALDFLSAILLKGMPSRQKIQLFKDLNISFLVQNKISLNFEDITLDNFQSHIVNEWAFLKNPEIISSIEQGPFGDIYKDFCLFLLTIRSNFILKIINELFLSIKNLSTELETKEIEDGLGLVAFKNGVEILEKLLPSLTLIISIESSEFICIKYESCKFLINFITSLSSNESYLSKIFQEFKNSSFFSNYISNILYSLLNTLRKSDSDYYFQVNTFLLESIDSERNMPDYGTLFLSMIELKPILVCEFMEMLIKNTLSDIQSLSFSQVDSVVFLLAKFGQASINEKKKLLKIRNNELSENKFPILNYYIKFVSLILNCKEITYFNCKCYKAMEPGIHREIFLRNSLILVFKNFADLIGPQNNNTLYFWNGESKQILNNILEILLSNNGFLNSHSIISYQSSKLILNITKSFNYYLFDYIPKIVLILKSHNVLNFIYNLIESENIKTDYFKNNFETKSLNIICEAIGFLLYNKLKSTNNLSEKQAVIQQYEDIIQHLLELSHKLIDSMSSIQNSQFQIQCIKWKCSVELILMISSISDAVSEVIPSITHLWRASINTLLILADKYNFGFSNKDGWHISILSPIHRFIRIIGPEICTYVLPLLEAFLNPFIKINNSIDFQPLSFLGTKYSEACEEISQFVCHVITLHGASNEFNDNFFSFFSKIFLNMLNIWLNCWPVTTSILTLNNRTQSSMFEEIAFSIEAHQARNSIQLSILKIINLISRGTNIDLLIKFFSIDGELINKTRQIIREITINPVGIASNFGFKTYIDLCPSIFLFRDALNNIKNPLISFLITCFTPSLSTPIHWLEYNSDCHLFNNQDSTSMSLEVITSIYSRILAFSNINPSGDISQELANINIEIITSFLWFSILNSSKDDNILNSKITLLRLLINGEVPNSLIDRFSLKQTNKKSQNNLKFSNSNINSRLVPQNIVIATRNLVLSGTKVALTQQGSKILQNNSEISSFIRKSINLFSGYHYYIFLSCNPINGLLDEAVQLMNEIMQTQEPQFKQLLRKFVDKYQTYVRQVI